jgi:DNA-binding beta-propeller fold protein YncE
MILNLLTIPDVASVRRAGYNALEETSMRMTAAMAGMFLLAGCGAAEQSARAQALENAAGTLLVANKRGGSLSRLDLATGAETHRVDSCANPHELAVSPDRRHVALACYSGQELEIYRTADLGFVRRIELGEGARPHGVVWHSSGTLIASAEGRGSIVVVEAPLAGEARVREIGEGPPGPHMVVVDEAGEFAWGTIIPTGTVVRYDIAAGRETARRVLGGQTEGIALAPDGGVLWVGANQAGKVYRLDPETLEVQGEVEAGPVPIRVAAHPGGRWLVSSNFGSGGLSVIDAASNEMAREVPVSGEQGAAQVTLVFSADGSRLYAAETATDTIAEVDFATGHVLRRLPTGEGGDGLAVFE